MILIFYAGLIFPFIATLFELVALITGCARMSGKESCKAFFERHPRLRERGERYSECGFVSELILYALCFLLEYFAMELSDVRLMASWTEQLYNRQRHQPIASEYWITVIAIMVIFFVGLVVLYVTDVRYTPPLVTSLAISALYIGCIYTSIWTYHYVGNDGMEFVYFLLLPLNTILISARLIVQKTAEYEPDKSRMDKIENNAILNFYNRMCQNSVFLPIAGLILMIPLLGVMIIFLLLFGQSPDAAIKAFTETSDFRLSTKISPQNLYYDEHYLCTVAAGGDRKIVKPLRRGVRHGHEVTVNRQLEVANAFEEVIQVRTPKFHRHLRHFYDTYGFPIARLIKRNWVADMVYFIMKPLEYIFVIFLYLTEVHPEDRIALQYTGTTLERFNKQ